MFFFLLSREGVLVSFGSICSRLCINSDVLEIEKKAVKGAGLKSSKQEAAERDGERGGRGGKGDDGDRRAALLFFPALLASNASYESALCHASGVS